MDTATKCPTCGCPIDHFARIASFRLSSSWRRPRYYMVWCPVDDWHVTCRTAEDAESERHRHDKFLHGIEV